MEHKWLIYKHTNLINGKVYIGQTCQDPKKRWGNGLSQYKHNKYFLAAINKYGWDNFSHEILRDSLTENEMRYWEKYYIDFYDSLNPQKGYNLVEGGVSSPFVSLWKDNEFRDRRSKEQSLMMKQKMQDPEQKKQLIEAGKRYWQNNPKAKEEQSKRMTNTLNKLWQDDEYRNKQSIRFKEYLENHKEQQVAHAKKNARKNWENPEYRKKICKAVRNIETGLVFQSAAQAARWCGLADRSSITKYLTQSTRSAGKHPETKEPLHWEYVKEGGD